MHVHVLHINVIIVYWHIYQPAWTLLCVYMYYEASCTRSCAHCNATRSSIALHIAVVAILD
jgi:hypothetical protein